MLPTLVHKKRAVRLSLQVERDLSAYLLTVTAINAAVGCATAAIIWLCGVTGPLLWGAVASCLNFVPIPRPFVGVVLFLARSRRSCSPVRWWDCLPTPC